jgi:hypothetical protein
MQARTLGASTASYLARIHAHIERPVAHEGKAALSLPQIILKVSAPVY